jgi:hypothetical protein
MLEWKNPLFTTPTKCLTWRVEATASYSVAAGGAVAWSSSRTGSLRALVAGMLSPLGAAPLRACLSWLPSCLTPRRMAFRTPPLAEARSSQEPSSQSAVQVKGSQWVTVKANTLCSYSGTINTHRHSKVGTALPTCSLWPDPDVVLGSALPLGASVRTAGCAACCAASRGRLLGRAGPSFAAGLCALPAGLLLLAGSLEAGGTFSFVVAART